MKKLQILILLLLFSLAIPAKGSTVYVDGTASGLDNGSSWANAYQDLQTALQTAIQGDVIWVAIGIYTPTNNSNRDSTFDLRNQVNLLGGFLGNETAASQRNPSNRTVLSGNIGNPNDPTDNSKHLCWVSNSNVRMTLDGFVVEDGYSENSSGAAIYTHDGFITFINCVFRNNFSAWGGAICSTTSSMDYIDCVFEKNSGIYGGAYQSWGGTSDRFFNCDFIENSSVQTGGAITAQLRSDLTLENCRFYGNEAEEGGAIYIEHQGKITCMNNIFNGNHANMGAAIFVADTSTFNAYNSVIVQNRADCEGGGIFLGYGEASLYNSILRDNIANMNHPNIGGDTSTLNFGNCNLEQMRPGQGNMTGNPLFVDPDGPDNIPGNMDDDFHFLQGAPGLNSGDSLAMPLDRFDRNNNGDTTELFPFDLELNPRIQGGNLDRGPFESNIILAMSSHLENEMVVGKLYPNPSPTSFVDIEMNQGQKVEIWLLDMMGNRIELLLPEAYLVGANHLKLDPQIKTAGLYLLEIRSRTQTVYRRWVL